MNISYAKKVMLDRVHLATEEAQLNDEIREKEKQVKKLVNIAEEKQKEQNSLENSGMRQFFLGLMGKKEQYLQDAQNEVRRSNSELSAAKFELESLQKKSEEIRQTIQETESVCHDCVKIIAEDGGQDIRMKLLAITEVPNLCATISEKMAAMNPHFNNSYAIWRVGEPTASAFDGNANNRSKAMRKHCKLIENGVNEIIELLNTYNSYVPDEIKIEFHDKWMDNEKFWTEQDMPENSLDICRKVEDWAFRLETCWKGMKKQQTATMQTLREEVLAYLDI